jgi:hypothetical protein
VALARTDLSEICIASIIKVDEIRELADSFNLDVGGKKFL